MKPNKLIRQLFCCFLSTIMLGQKWGLSCAAKIMMASSFASSRSTTTYRPSQAQYIAAGPAWSATTSFVNPQPPPPQLGTTAKFGSQDGRSKSIAPNLLQPHPHYLQSSLYLHNKFRPHSNHRLDLRPSDAILSPSVTQSRDARSAATSAATNSVRTLLKRATSPVPVEINRCSRQTFEDCLSMMQEVMQNSSLAYPTDNQSLDLVCRKLKEGDHCAEQYIRSCAGNQLRLLYQDIVKGTKNVIRLLCQHGEPRQLYLQFSSCYKDVHNLDRCSTELQAITNAMGTEADGGNKMAVGPVANKNDDKKLQQFCCAYKDSFECQLINIQQFCGDKGMEYFKRYLGEMTSALINEHCIGYTYSNKCRPYRQKTSGLDRNQQQQSSQEMEDIEEESWDSGEADRRQSQSQKESQKPRMMNTNSASSLSTIFWSFGTTRVLRIVAVLVISIRICNLSNCYC